MIFDRHYEPKDGEILYHYCSGETFAAICSSKSLRLGDFFAMNDFMEMHWGYAFWELAAGHLIDKLGKDFLDEIDKIIHASGFHILTVGTCFSLDGDVLSQWRGYANDGNGYCIGFDGNVFPDLPARPLRVLYDKDQQIKEAMAAVLSIHEVEKEENFTFGNDFFNACASFGSDLLAFKNPAFAEEREVRIIHALDFEKSNESMRVFDGGGHAFGQDVEGAEVGFRMKDEVPAAFIDVDFTSGGAVNPIKEVVLGPKNDAIPQGVSIYLETMGIGNVTLRKSEASYR